MSKRHKENLNCKATKARKKKLLREAEDEAQRKLRLERQRIRQSQKRAKESESDRQRRLVADRERHRKARKQESSAKREQRLATDRIRKAISRGRGSKIEHESDDEILKPVSEFLDVIIKEEPITVMTAEV